MAFRLFSVFGYPDETQSLVFDILRETQQTNDASSKKALNSSAFYPFYNSFLVFGKFHYLIRSNQHLGL